MPAAKAVVMPRVNNRTRSTLDLTREQHRFVKRFALETNVEVSKIMRVPPQLLETDRARSAGSPES
jgi:hypothetical protein